MEDLTEIRYWQSTWTDDPCDDCTHWVGQI